MPPQILPITLKSSPLAIALVRLQLPTIISPSHHVTESRVHRRLPQALVRSQIPTFWGAKSSANRHNLKDKRSKS